VEYSVVPVATETRDCKEVGLAFTTLSTASLHHLCEHYFQVQSIQPSELPHGHWVQCQSFWRARRNRQHGNQWIGSSSPTSANGDMSLRREMDPLDRGLSPTFPQSTPLRSQMVHPQALKVHDPHKICFSTNTHVYFTFSSVISSIFLYTSNYDCLNICWL